MRGRKCEVGGAKLEVGNRKWKIKYIDRRNKGSVFRGEVAEGLGVS